MIDYDFVQFIFLKFILAYIFLKFKIFRSK
nr:MAG TPA: hypothetical protein [Inoviridae sp.]